MAARAGIVLVVALVALAGSVSGTATRPSTSVARVERVVDGDTIVLAGGARVRFLQIDTPEPGTAECYSRAAGRDLRRMLPAGAVVTLEADPALDQVDRYGRLLRYVHRAGRNLNLALVRDGSATVWFYDDERGRYATALLTAGRAARKAHRGLWGACPHAVWDPSRAATTGPGSGAATTAPRTAVGGRCDPSYPTICIPSPPPDLDCADIPYRRFRVRPPDPHHFDGGGDGIGCESG
jgi:endonuclease YncB( thermonuclease family)